MSEKNVLFNGEQEVSNDEVIDKMKHLKEKAQKGMKLYETNKRETLRLAKELRNELKDEYKNNQLLRIEKIYKDHDLFRKYQKAVHEALVSVTGALSYDKLFSFLYDVYDYMLIGLPKDKD